MGEGLILDRVGDQKAPFNGSTKGRSWPTRDTSAFFRSRVARPVVVSREALPEFFLRFFFFFSN